MSNPVHAGCIWRETSDLRRVNVVFIMFPDEDRVPGSVECGRICD